MNKILFEVELAYKYLVRHKGINIIVLISISLGLLLPFMALGNINVFFTKSETLNIKDPNSVIIADIVMQQDLELLSNTMKECSDFAVVEKIVDTAEWNGESKSVAICRATINISNFENFMLVDGRWVTQDDIDDQLPVCMVSDGFAAHNGKISVGDIITYHNAQHIVVGVFRSLNYYTHVFDFVDAPINLSRGNTYRIYLRTVLAVDKMMEYLQRKDMTITQIDTANNISEDAIKRGIVDSALVFVVALLSLFFATINITAILYGNFNLQIKRIGIELTIGSSCLDTFLVSFFSHVMLLLTAIPLVWFESYIIRHIIPKSVEMIFNARIYIVTFCLGLVICVVANMLLLLGIQKLNVVEVLGDSV